MISIPADDFKFATGQKMNNEIENALKNLRDVLQANTHEHCTGVNVFFNCNGYEIEYNFRTPDSLKSDGISMRNIKGDFIQSA